MKLFGWLRRDPPQRLANITVYCLNAIERGQSRAAPVGICPHLPATFEAEIRGPSAPENGSYTTAEVNGATVTCYWQHARIEAVCLMRTDDLSKVDGFQPFTGADLEELRPVLKHFPG